MPHDVQWIVRIGREDEGTLGIGPKPGAGVPSSLMMSSSRIVQVPTINSLMDLCWALAPLGIMRVKDPETSRIYEMPFEAWDGTIGGYRNPVRPTEIRQKTEPGE
jgi:hypothetical protein